MPNPEYKTIRTEFSQEDSDSILQFMQSIETELESGWSLYGRIIHYTYTKPSGQFDKVLVFQVWAQTLVRNYTPLEEGPIGPQGPQGPQGLQGIQGNPGPSNHGSLTGLSNDDHMQYVPVNASRGFINPVTGSFPSATNHLATKNYVDYAAWPVGSIFISTISANPFSYLGFGTWSAFGQGRVLIGVDQTDTGPVDPLDIGGLTGGSKRHTLTETEMPSHTHTVPTGTGVSGFINELRSQTFADAPDLVSGATGGNQSHQNLPPYITIFMWRRVS